MRPRPRIANGYLAWLCLGSLTGCGGTPASHAPLPVSTPPATPATGTGTSAPAVGPAHIPPAQVKKISAYD